MKNLEQMTIREQQRFFDRQTPNNLIKAGLVSSFPTLLDILGFSSQDKKRIWEAVLEDTGIANGDYPFYSPMPIETLAESSFLTPTIGDNLRRSIREKYKGIGRELAYLNYKIGSTINSSIPSYYVFVSNDLDLLKALFSIQEYHFGELNIPKLEKKIDENDPRNKTHLIKGTQAYDLYHRLRGDTSIPETSLEKYLRDYPLDTVIVVTPEAAFSGGIPLQVYRRKSPMSIADKFGYSIIAYLLNIAYSVSFQRQKPPETRISKYSTYKKCGVKDIPGLATISPYFSTFGVSIESSNLSSLLGIRNKETISETGEVHWDVNFLNPKEIEPTLGISPQGIGRIEVHSLSDISHYFRMELLGPTSRPNFKTTRRRETEEAHPIKSKKKAVEKGLKFVSDRVNNIFMPGINLSSYPGSYYLVNPSGIPTPKFGSLVQTHDTSRLDDVITLYNPFPWQQ